MQAFLDFFVRVAGDWGLWIVFAIVFLETSAMVGLLVPGETTVILAGALASQGVLDLGDLVVVVCVAAVLGDTVGYLLGRRLGRDFLLRHGRIFRIKPRHVERTEGFFERHGGKTVLFGRWVGFLRSLAPFIAGSARMRYSRFAVYDLAGVLSWGLAVTLLGYGFGRSYYLAERWLGRIVLFIVLLVVSGFLLTMLGRWLWVRREGLGRLAFDLTDRIVGMRAVAAFGRRFSPQIRWVSQRFSPRRTFGLGLTLGLIVSLLLGWAFGAILEDVLAREPLTLLDRTVAQTLHDHAIPWVTSIMIVLTALGSAWVLVPASLAVGAYLVARRRWGDALVLVTATSGAAMLNVALKLLIQRPRPDFLVPLVEETGYSFPSGHASAAAAFYMTLALLATGWVRHWETRVYVLLAAVAVVVIVGFSRMYLGVHYLSDVLAGFALGAFWSTVSITASTVFVRAHAARGAAPAERHPVAPAERHVAASEQSPTLIGLSPAFSQEQEVIDPMSEEKHDGEAHGKVFSPKKAAVLDDVGRLEWLSEETLARLLSLDGHEDVADLGSGTGFWANRVASWTTGRLYAIELQQEMLDIHRRNGAPDNVELTLADAGALPLPEGSIDRAFSVNTFHESHGSEGLELLARALRPGGLFVIVDWRRDPEAAVQGPPLEHRLSEEQVREALDPWFEVIEEEVVSVPFFAVVAQRR